MKKSFILILFFIVNSIVSLAQVGGVVYNPYIPGQNRSNNNSQSQSVQAYSVTAYQVDAYGYLQSMQLKVAIENQNTSTYALSTQPNMYVIAQYVRTGYAGAYWAELPTRPIVYQCNAYSNDAMEQRFMYKARVGVGYVYFNL